MARPSAKASGAFRTIGELSDETGIPQHVLRYWEGRFPQLRPLTRAGNRRYYRPDDIALVRRIDDLLNRHGYTIRGVQQVLDADRKGARVGSQGGVDGASAAGDEDAARASTEDGASAFRGEVGAAVAVTEDVPGGSVEREASIAASGRNAPASVGRHAETIAHLRPIRDALAQALAHDADG